MGTAEHFLSAAGSLLQERRNDFSELKSFLLNFFLRALSVISLFLKEVKF
jgi:hypothetical protein